MSILKTFHENNVRRWILLRMAASEFYFKQPYDVKEEYPIMTSVLGFALMPILLIFVFLYARLNGSLTSYNLPIIIAMFVLSFGTAFLIIRNIKNAPFIDKTILDYESMDLQTRKKIYSFKNGFKVTFIMILLPWLVCGIAVTVICHAVPRA